MKVTEGDLERYFSKFGTVQDVVLLRDRNTGKHKGFAYVEMARLDDIPACLEKNETVPDFQKFPIIVRPNDQSYTSAAHRVQQQRGGDAAVAVAAATAAAAAAAGSNNSVTPTNKLFLASIPQLVDEPTLAEILKFYGPLESIKLVVDPTKPVNIAFVRYQKPHDAAVALATLHGFQLGQHKLVVQFQKS